MGAYLFLKVFNQCIVCHHTAHAFYKGVVKPLANECEPVDDVESEEENWKGDQEDFVNSPIFFCQLLNRKCVGRTLMNLIFEIVLANNLSVYLVLTRYVSLLLEKDCCIPEM